MRVSLLDEDGDVLSTGYLNQMMGQVVNIGTYAPNVPVKIGV